MGVRYSFRCPACGYAPPGDDFVVAGLCILPSLLNTEEFAFLVRRSASHIRELASSGRIKAKGRPHRIPCRELERFGVDLASAARPLQARSLQPF